MKKHLKYIDGASDKFWQIEAQGIQFTVTYGKNGTAGTTQTKTFLTETECLKMAEKLVAEKVKKGYSESGEVVVDSSSKTGKAKTAIQEITAEYDSILKEKREADLLPFLQEKVKGNITEFKKHLKKCKKYWCDYADLTNESQFKKNSSYNWGRRGDVIQLKIINLTAIALVDKTEINAFDWIISYLEYIQKDSIIKDIIYWAKPNWISEYLLNSIRKNEWATIDYFILRHLEEEQLLEYNPELFALNLAHFNEYRAKDSARNYIKKLTQDTVAIQRDVPLLFEYPTPLNNVHFRDNNNQKYNEFKLWQIAFVQLINGKLLERSFFIEKCLLIQTKEWNNGAKGVFKNVLLEIEPTAEELIVNQQTIFTFLQNAYPPIISLGVDLIKVIIDHSKFKTNDFLEWIAPVFYREDAKGSIKKLFPIFDKLVKNNPKNGKKCALLLGDVFVIPDLSLQEKAAKFIVKNSTKKDVELTEKLNLYSSQMQGKVKTELAALMHFGEIENEKIETEIYQFSSNNSKKLAQKVKLPVDWNGILFQFGVFITSDDFVEAEILLHSLLLQQDLFPKDFQKELEPYTKQLQKTYFDNELKQFCTAYLIQKIIHWDRIADLKYSGYQQIKLPQFFKTLLQLIDKKINSKSKLPLLSFPTHHPHWVEAKTLLERIIAYQNANEAIDINDLTLAIARMPKENLEEAIKLLPQLDSELKNLFEFCFGVHKEIKIPNEGVLNKLFHTVGGETIQSKNIALWAVAAQTFYPNEHFQAFEKTIYSKVPFAGKPFTNPITFKEKYNEWVDYHTKEKMRHCWIELRLELPEFKKIPVHMLYSLDSFNVGGNKWNNMLYGQGTIYYWNSLMPQNNEPLAIKLLTTTCVNTSENVDVLKAFLQIANRLDFDFTHYCSYVFACCFFMDKKDARLLASEILYQKIEHQTFPIEQMSTVFANLISNNYGVFGRFSDAVLSIKDSSPLHNQALFLLLDGVLSHWTLGEKLPTNFKKFIENYYDLVTKLNEKPSEKAKQFLMPFRENASLKKLVNLLLQ